MHQTEKNHLSELIKTTEESKKQCLNGRSPFEEFSSASS